MAKTMVWSDNSNFESVNDFEGELNKESPSNGSFKEDLDKLLLEFPNLIICPFIKCSSKSIASQEDGIDDIIVESVKIMNCTIDRASWRLVLIACTLLNSKVKEIVVHGSELSKGHIEDMILALSRFCTIESLKMEYVLIKPESNSNITEEEKGEENESTPTESPESTICLGDLLKPELGLKYISLRGCSLSSSFITNVMCQALPTTWGLEALNINNNTFDDNSMSKLIKAIAIAPNLKSVSMSKCVSANKLEMEVETSSSSSISTLYVSNIIGLFRGIDITTSVSEIEEEINNANKIAADFNKALKDTNKRRKKGNLEDLPDVVPITVESRILDGPAAPDGDAITTEGEETLPSKLLVNHNIQYIDCSDNIPASKDDISNALSRLCSVKTLDEGEASAQAETEPAGAGTNGKSKIIIKLVGSGLNLSEKQNALIQNEFDLTL